MNTTESSDCKQLPRTPRRRCRPGCATIVICQNLVLWMSLYVIASTVYILVVGAMNTQDVPSAVMYLVASVLTLLYLCLQNFGTRLRREARSTIDGERVDGYQSLAAHTLPILITLWMVANGLCITFTAARRPLCVRQHPDAGLSALDTASTCIINRVTILAGLVAMIAAIMLFLLMRNINGASRCHLFGIVPERKLLPLYLAQKQRTLRTMPSEISFKCRSSISISSRAIPRTLDEHDTMPTTSPPHPHSRLQSQGIRLARSSAPPPFFPSRPSLAPIRSHASLPLPPPPSCPLPPLPTHLPLRQIQPNSTMPKAIYPPRSFSRPTRPPPAKTAYLQIPAPALSRENLARLLGRHDSLSSIYSRDTTGASQVIPRITSRPSLTSGFTSISSSSSRSTSLASEETTKRSPSGIQPGHAVTHRRLASGTRDTTSEESSSSNEDGARFCLQPPISIRRRSRNDRDDNSIVDSIDIFAPLPPPLSVNRETEMGNLTAVERGARERKQQKQKQDCCVVSLEERLRRYAESQSLIRRQTGAHIGSSVRTRGCPERFRFE